LFSLIVVFRPSLHRLWGFMLLTFHFGVFLLMDISFELQPLVLSVLFLFSPFAPERTNWRHTCRQLPILALILRLYGRFGRSTAKRRPH
jgi:hypothetical protein